MIPLSHLSYVQCRQEKFRPKKKVKIKVFHSVVMDGGGGGGGGGGEAGVRGRKGRQA